MKNGQGRIAAEESDEEYRDAPTDRRSGEEAPQKPNQERPSYDHGTTTMVLKTVSADDTTTAR
jgi:hypothetical protein